MGKSGRLRLRDLRTIYGLIGECRDLGADPHAWRAHLLTRLCALVGARSTAFVEASLKNVYDVQILGNVSAGWPDPASETVWRRFLENERPESDPLYEPLMKLLPAPGCVATRARHQLVTDRQWFGSRHYHEYRRTAGTGECVYSYSAGREGEETILNCIEVYRDLNNPPFDARQQRMIHWLHHELCPHIGRQLAWLHEPSASALAPRQRETLVLLLSGDSEKQIAARLGLSRATVHEYVMAIYRHFDVHSRAELLARWLRFR